MIVETVFNWHEACISTSAIAPTYGSLKLATSSAKRRDSELPAPHFIVSSRNIVKILNCKTNETFANLACLICFTPKNRRLLNYVVESI
ncbi:MAG: hypothetical protein APF81_01645 [Desulfosporosinus sp. BRH_c37]|nr:MAG: hypothetical protein APF81_01645 [Desulfosporosinus sp. BRH_c37]